MKQTPKSGIEKVADETGIMIVKAIVENIKDKVKTIFKKNKTN